MEIWAHTLVKNEARWLWYSVSSVINNVDKLLLWDTGSTDMSIGIEEDLLKAYPNKIIYRQRRQDTAHDFAIVRQEILDETKSDWFVMLDGDEIWWKDSINKVIKTIHSDHDLESIVVPTINVVGDIFHFQNKSAGRYNLAGRVGHYNLRGINRNIPGLRSLGSHGVWGWADGDGKMIQNRAVEKIRFVDAPYIHTTFLHRGGLGNADKLVIKRSRKYKHEIGNSFPSDYFYPEVLFENRPKNIPSPWGVSDLSFKARSYIETPLRQIKRKIWIGKTGY